MKLSALPIRARSTSCAWALAALLANACAQPPAPPPQAPAHAHAHAAAQKPLDPDAFRAEAPKPGAHSAVQFPTPSEKKLKNGVTLLVLPKRAAVTTLSVVAREGASSLAPGKSGLAALTARMLTEGTQRRSSLALAEASEALGSALGADAGRDESHVELSVLSRDVVRGLELLAEVVFKPAFRDADFARVKGEWLDGLRAERQEPSRLASLAALRSLLGPSAGAPVSGGIPDVEKLTVADLKAFHARSYVPENLAVIAVGDVTLAELEPDVERLFGQAKGAARAPLTPITPVEAPSRLELLLVDRKDSVQSSLFAIQPFPKRSEPGFEARELMSSLLGGLFTSRLNSNLREKNAYTYGVHGQTLATRQWGAFYVATEVKTETTAEALEQLLNELERARDPKRGAPIDEAETERARADVIHSLGARLEHTSLLADSMGTLFSQGLPSDYYSRYPALVKGIPLSEVAAQAARLTPQRMIVVIVGDRAQIEGGLVKRGYQPKLADPRLLE
ncbi:MAG TPA: pitrilysin family protein [Polyangiaceae bacterium]|nr:pitrilysin family protein [Polyangiaceae bacterium]